MRTYKTALPPPQHPYLNGDTVVVSVTSHVGAVIGDGHQVPLPRPDG